MGYPTSGRILLPVPDFLSGERTEPIQQRERYWIQREASRLLRERQFLTAQRLYDRLACSGDLGAVVCMGILYHEAGFDNLAWKLLKSVAPEKRSDPVLHYYLGRIRESQGKYDEALQCYTHAACLNTLDKKHPLQSIFHLVLEHEKERVNGIRAMEQGSRNVEDQILRASSSR
ncbi:tetratricopeptide repeat protein [Candidatus Woesearchaeota archaeon]|nr:tetratricopeptide repeat protein [Candidatus Woesearchaeota archaeon]